MPRFPSAASDSTPGPGAGGTPGTVSTVSTVGIASTADSSLASGASGATPARVRTSVAGSPQAVQIHVPHTKLRSRCGTVPPLRSTPDKTLRAGPPLTAPIQSGAARSRPVGHLPRFAPVAPEPGLGRSGAGVLVGLAAAPESASTTHGVPGPTTRELVETLQKRSGVLSDQERERLKRHGLRPDAVAPFTALEQQRLDAAGIPEALRSAYRIQDVAVTEETLPPVRYRNLSLQPMPGGISQAHPYVCLTQAPADWREIELVFKRQPRPRVGAETVCGRLGIFGPEARYSERSLLALRIARELRMAGFEDGDDVGGDRRDDKAAGPGRRSDKSLIASLGKLGPPLILPVSMASDEHHTLGTVVERIKGVGLHQLRPEQLRQPLLRKRLADLQLFDALVGNVDRHGGNVLVQLRRAEPPHRVVGESGPVLKTDIVTGVFGLDHDRSWIPVEHPDDLLHVAWPRGDGKAGAGLPRLKRREERFEAEWMRGTLLPRIFDTAQAAALARISHEIFAALLDARCVPERDRPAHMQRFQTVKQIVARAPRIDADEWGEAVARRNLDGPVQSYAGRAESVALARGAREGRAVADVPVHQRPRSKSLPAVSRGWEREGRVAPRAPERPATAAPARDDKLLAAAAPAAAPAALPSGKIGIWPGEAWTTVHERICKGCKPETARIELAEVLGRHEHYVWIYHGLYVHMLLSPPDRRESARTVVQVTRNLDGGFRFAGPALAVEDRHLRRAVPAGSQSDPKVRDPEGPGARGPGR